MRSIVFSDSKAICLLLVGLFVLRVTGAGTNFTTTPKDKEVFVGSSVQFDWDFIDSEDVEDVRFGFLDPIAGSGAPKEVAIVKKKDGRLEFNNMDQSIEWLRDRVEVVPGRRASFKIKSVKMDDSRTFVCTLMTRSIGSVINTVKLTVVDLLIDKLSSTISIESWQGHRLTAVCAVNVTSGGTNAKFSWMYVPSNRVIAREKHDDTQSKSYLILTTYKDEDFEALQCRAETKRTTKFHVINITKLSSPTEPRNLKAERVFNSQSARLYIRLHWDPPKNNGGTMIKSYIVSYVPQGLPWKSSTNDETEKTEFSDLRVSFGNIYKARVRAKNKAGTGPSSNEIEINLGIWKIENAECRKARIRKAGKTECREKIGADIVGLNCLFGPDETLQTIALMKEALDKEGLKPHVMVQPVCYHTPDAGPRGFISLPELPFALEPRLLTRWDVRKYARRAYDLGVRYIGGCCGFQPYHIRAIAEELAPERGRLPAASDKHSPWGEALKHHAVAEVRARANRTYWENLKPASGRPFCPLLSGPEGLGLQE